MQSPGASEVAEAPLLRCLQFDQNVADFLQALTTTQGHTACAGGLTKSCYRTRAGASQTEAKTCAVL